MRIVVDTREQVPWTFEGLGVETVREKLDEGDYSVEGFTSQVVIERKSLGDWVGTVMTDRPRFYRELDRMRGYAVRAVVIEANVRDIMARRYQSDAHPNSILGFIGEVSVSQAVPVYLGGTRAEAQILAAALLGQAAKRLRKLG